MRDDKLLDRPISSQEADLLGFTEVAGSLANAIKAQPNTTSLTLGLDGPWGSGKSSIFWLLQHTLKRDESEEGIGLVVVPFSPWLITNRTALVAAFFGQLGDAIDEAAKRVPKNRFFWKKNAARTLNRARKSLNQFSKFASIASTATSVVDPTLISAVAAGGTKALERFTDASENKGPTLEKLKDELSASLREIASTDNSFRILVLIDDLDRLDPGDALEILRLVKAVGDFPAVTYLLAYDRKAIASAIAHTVKIDDGDAYLEKIIQFSFKVPPLEPFQLRNWLKLELDDLFPGEIEHGSGQARAVLDVWAGRLLQTPRDVKRLLFSVRAVWPRLESKANLLDLVWLQMIAQKASQPEVDLYSWVVRYLQGLDAIAIGGQISGEKEDREELEQILGKLGWKTYETGDKGMSFDFHHLDELLAGVTNGYLGQASLEGDAWTHKLKDQELQEFRDAQRLSSPWHWRLYFALDTPSHAITDDEWQALVSAAETSTQELGISIGKVLDFRGAARKDAADQIIERVIYGQKAGKLSHPDRWVVAVIEHAEVLAKSSKRDRMFGMTRISDIQLKILARVIFRNLNGPERDGALKIIFEDANNLCLAAELVRDQFHASKKDDYEKGEKFFLSAEELEIVIKSQVILYESLSVSDFQELASPYEILYAWRDVTDSKVGPAKLLKEAFKKDRDLVKTLDSLKCVSSSAQNGIPHVPEGFLEIFLDAKSIKIRLEKLAASKSEHASGAADILKVWWPAKDS